MRKKLLYLLMLAPMAIYAQSGLNLDGFYTSFNKYQYQNCIDYMNAFIEHREGKDRLIWLLNNGVVNSYAGNYELSNEYFTQAQHYFDEIKLNMGNEALAYMLNPTKREYRGEDAELLMTHYYKVFNYLYLNDKAKALTELDKMDSILNSLLEEGMDKDKGLNKIALIYLLKGLIYDTEADYQNAFSNYYQAYDCYSYNYKSIIDLPSPLKKDLIRTAFLTNATNELDKFESEFGITYEQIEEAGNIIAFWNNGLGPVKKELTLNFSMSTQGGGIRFVNHSTGESFPLAATAVAGAASLLSKGGSVKMAYPQYYKRSEFFDRGTIVVDNNTYPLTHCEDVNTLAIKSLQARKNKEMAEMLTRFAVKQAGKAGAKKLLGKGLEQVGLSSLKGLADKGLDAAAKATEKADLRHWGTLPNSIYYTRFKLSPGINNITFQASVQGNQTRELIQQVNVEAGNSQFIWFNTHEHHQPTALPSNLVASANPNQNLQNPGYALAQASNSNPYQVNATPASPTTEPFHNDLSQPLPELTTREYLNHLKHKEIYYSQVIGNAPKELKHGFRMGGKELLTANYYIDEKQITPIDDKVYLDIKFNTKVRKKIIAIQDLSSHIQELIRTDLRASLYPNLTNNINEADYRLLIEINDVVARNNHFIMYLYGVIPAYTGLPTGFPKYSIQYNARLYNTNNQLLGSSQTNDSKQSVMFGLYRFSKQIGRARNKNNPLKTNPMEEVMRNTMGQIKQDIYRGHMENKMADN
ncbi:MAG: hypothetical protein AB7E36_01525 [Salinivirgaceae bacterium]